MKGKANKLSSFSCYVPNLLKRFSQVKYLYTFDLGGGGGGGGERVTPRKFGRSVYHASQNPYPTYIYDQNGQIDTLFMTKTAEKPHPLGPHIPI